MKQNTGSPTLVKFVVPAEAERIDAALLREEYAHTDPATGRVLWTVDSYDLEAYENLIAEEFEATQEKAPYALSRAARQSLGLFVVAEIEVDLRRAA